MPKMKSNRSAARRFWATGSGRVRRGKANHRHLLTKKSAKRKNRLVGTALVHERDEVHIRRLLPYL